MEPLIYSQTISDKADASHCMHALYQDIHSRSDHVGFRICGVTNHHVGVLELKAATIGFTFTIVAPKLSTHHQIKYSMKIFIKLGVYNIQPPLKIFSVSAPIYIYYDAFFNNNHRSLKVNNSLFTLTFN